MKCVAYGKLNIMWHKHALEEVVRQGQGPAILFCTSFITLHKDGLFRELYNSSDFAPAPDLMEDLQQWDMSKNITWLPEVSNISSLSKLNQHTHYKKIVDTASCYTSSQQQCSFSF